MILSGTFLEDVSDKKGVNDDFFSGTEDKNLLDICYENKRKLNP